MKKQIRNNVFETNSSSTHSLIICTPEQSDLLTKGKMYIYDYDTLCTEDERINIILNEYQKEFTIEGTYEEFYDNNAYKEFYDKNSEMLEEYFSEHSYAEFQSYEEWVGELESDETYYTSKSGDKIIILCKYGHD